MLTFNNNKGLYKFRILERYPEVLQFVTTRHNPDGSGSVFNIGFGGGIPEQVVECRQKLASALSISPDKFVFMNQVHGDNIYVADPETIGCGFYSKDTAIPDTDILVTNQLGVCLVARSADCIPVLLYSPDVRAVAAIHSGREGTYLGCAVKAMRKLTQLYGANPANTIACIGPGINGDCYEVDLDCAEKFLLDSRFAPDTIAIKGSKAFLDLKKMIFYDLLTAGFVANNIEISDICTKCTPLHFYSARRGDKQRFCAGICIRE